MTDFTTKKMSLTLVLSAAVVGTVFAGCQSTSEAPAQTQTQTKSADGTEKRRPWSGERGQRFEQAAQTLGVSSEDLRNAMRDAGGRDADMSVVAQKLGVSEEALRAALPTRRQRP